MHEKLNVLYSIVVAVDNENFERYRVFPEGGRRFGYDWRAASFPEAVLALYQRELHRFLAMSTVCIRHEPAEFNPRGILRKAGSIFTTVASLSGGAMVWYLRTGYANRTEGGFHIRLRQNKVNMVTHD